MGSDHPSFENWGHGNASGNGNGSGNGNSILSPSINVNLFGKNVVTNVYNPPKSALDPVAVAIATGAVVVGGLVAGAVLTNNTKARESSSKPNRRTLAEEVMAHPSAAR
jgi:hypothetical protein